MKSNKLIKKVYFSKLKKIQQILKKSQKFKKESYTITKSGIKIKVFKNVFSPSYFDDSLYFAENLPDVKGLEVLEIGTGTGLLAIKLAMNNAKSVVATDINPNAVENAKFNVRLHNLESKIEVREGYIFKPIQNEMFDIIFWNIPFCYIDTEFEDKLGLTAPFSYLENAVFNPYYNLMYDFLLNGPDYLNPDGRLLLGFSPTLGRDDILNDLIKRLRLEKMIIKEDILEFDNIKETLQILEFKKNDTDK